MAASRRSRQAAERAQEGLPVVERPQGAVVGEVGRGFLAQHPGLCPQLFGFLAQAPGDLSLAELHNWM